MTDGDCASRGRQKFPDIHGYFRKCLVPPHVVSFPLRLGTKFSQVMSPTSGQGGVFMVVPLSPESPRLASDYCKEPGGPGYCCGCEGFIILAVAYGLNHAFLI